MVSGHVAPDGPRSTLDWEALARTGTTLVVLMGVQTLPLIDPALVDAGAVGTPWWPVSWTGVCPASKFS